MSYLSNHREKDLEDLKRFRDAIRNASNPVELEKEMKDLEQKLQDMQEYSAGDELQEVQMALKKVGAFWMHDETRFEVLRWVQTIMISLRE